MASTSSTQTTQPAPWKAAFLEHLSKMDKPEFVFSSLHPAPEGGPTSYLPRARFCIYRGFWAELPENKHNQAEQNERVYGSDLPTFTTDVRMQKQYELFASSSGHADDSSLVQGSGGGGPCEAVFWAKEAMIQWRIKGQAFIVGQDIEGEEGRKESSGVRTVKSEVGARMRLLKEEDKDKWSWNRELTAHFGNLAPGMRGSFANPPPGQPVDQPYDDKNLVQGQQINDLHDQVSRSNFRVVIIRPDEVESVDLNDPSSSRRQVYKYDSKTGEWSHQECWP